MNGGRSGVFLMEAEARNVLLPATSSYCLLSHVKYAFEVDEEDKDDGHLAKIEPNFMWATQNNKLECFYGVKDFFFVQTLHGTPMMGDEKGKI